MTCGPGKLDVITLSGMGRPGLWSEVYKTRGGFPKRKRMERKCIAWKTVGKGCSCRPVCASFTDRKKGTSKRAAVAKCDTQCKTRRHKSRKRKRR